MTPSALSLLVFAGWMLLLAITLVSYRSGLVLAGKRAANSFSPSGDDVPEWAQRLTRAHANCYENIPLFAALILLALATGNAGITDPLAPLACGARLGQSGVHLVSTSNAAVTVRAGLFAVQLGIGVYWVASLALS